MFLIGFAIVLFSFAFCTIMLNGDLNTFIDIPSLIVILVPVIGVLVATQSHRVFFAGLRAAILPKEEITEEMRGQAATLFRLLSKVAMLSGAIGALVSCINMLMSLDFSSPGAWAAFNVNLATALMTLLYGLLFAIAVCEPVVFILKKRFVKKR